MGKLIRTVLRGPDSSNGGWLLDQALETKARFIAQVMTGASTVRQAEDIGGQELSYAEVKAIASGNPAVLTLAEADAELQRLLVLKKHHADEQFLAWRKLRELPGDITRLERHRDGLGQDIATATAHECDPIVIGERRYSREDAPEALTLRLKTLPALVPQRTRSPSRHSSTAPPDTPKATVRFAPVEPLAERGRAPVSRSVVPRSPGTLAASPPVAPVVRRL
jgi:hypothetical protein